MAKIPTLPSSEITPEHIYRQRRRLMIGIGATLLGTAVASCASPLSKPAQPTATTNGTPQPEPMAKGAADELGDKLTPYQDVTTYNNFYEFSQDKEGVAPLAGSLKTRPWSLEVTGMVAKPQTIAIEDILKRFPSEERIYRLRCVEGWSMVIPWMGFPLKQLLALVEPTSQAKYVRFTTLMDPEQFPAQGSGWFSWPYVEGLRLDEANNDLAILGTGLYGKELLPQNGAPLRLVVPWKYGFKSIKSIVKIELTDTQPTSLWMTAAANEYGFYANVNPDVPHPRWSQSSERRIGELSRRKTLPFNGYAAQVADLYTGMDLRANY
ncbi:MAG: protein-methionine-sulfoxide reductase catalytic subunit MsrP [Roseiflexaceae bacterium]|nr:protein-methionine-sulfoxide reductase catalytic subunit MsrP [Roseiflexaceae bacterium]